MKIEPIADDYNPLGDEWPTKLYRLPDQTVLSVDLASDARLSEWCYFWLTFGDGGARAAWYRVFENGKQPPEWRPLKSSVKRVLKQTAVDDDDDEPPAQRRRARAGKVGAAEKLPPGQYLLEVKIGEGDQAYELAGIEFNVKAAPAKATPQAGEHQFSLTRPRCSATAVASLIKMPKFAVRGLSNVARPMRFNAGPEFEATDLYPEYLRVNGQPAARYPWPAITLLTLLPYLQEKHQITLTQSEHDKIARAITEARNAPQFFLTDAHRQAFLAKLDSPFPEQEMRAYFREHNDVDDPEAGKKMLDGIRALRQCLSVLDKNSVVLLRVSGH
ncbi:MAG TPA: hypothetical protein VLI90_04095 [Tepidisphaeraceae bacterium]|nr:hypothetical protein [Tepidisphaeraceae bacterium]